MGALIALAVAILGVAALTQVETTNLLPCLWDTKSVSLWLKNWGAQNTVVVEEQNLASLTVNATGTYAMGGSPAELGIGVDNATWVILLRVTGDWIVWVPEHGWIDGNGYMTDYCANLPPGAHLAPDDSKLSAYGQDAAARARANSR